MSYRVVVTRDDAQWLADVPELEGAHTFARSLPALDRYVREVIVLAADLPDAVMGELELDYVYDVSEAAVRDAAALPRRRLQLHDAEQELVTETERAAQRLARDGYSVRDIAVLTGVSYQRVSQLTRKAS